MPDGFVIGIVVLLVIVVYYVSLIILSVRSSSSQIKDKQFFEFFGISSDNYNIPEVSGKIQDKVLQLLDQNDLVGIDRAIEIATAAKYSSAIAVTFLKLKTQIKILEDKNRARK
jgi:hypothetical protein